MEKIIKIIKEKIQENTLTCALAVLVILMILNFIFKILQKFQK